MNLKSKEKACVVAKLDRIRIEIGMISNLKTLLIKFLTSNSPIFAKNGILIKEDKASIITYITQKINTFFPNNRDIITNNNVESFIE